MTANPQRPSRGELRLVAPPTPTAGGHRLCLVLNADPQTHATEISLVHPYVDLATATDGIVPRALAGTPYDIVVQTDLRGVVWTRTQVSRRVGRVTNATLETISDIVADNRLIAATEISVGTRLVGCTDRRWPFKVEEGAALDALTSRCTTALIHRHGYGRRMRHG